MGSGRRTTEQIVIAVKVSFVGKEAWDFLSICGETPTLKE